MATAVISSRSAAISIGPLPSSFLHRGQPYVRTISRNSCAFRAKGMVHHPLHTTYLRVDSNVSVVRGALEIAMRRPGRKHNHVARREVDLSSAAGVVCSAAEQ